MKKRKHGIEGWPRERNTVGEREGKGRDSWTGASANVLFKAVGVAAASWLVIYELIPKSWTPWGWLRTLTRDLLLSGYVIDRLAPAPFALVKSTRPNPLSLSFLPSFLISSVAIFFLFSPDSALFFRDCYLDLSTYSFVSICILGCFLPGNPNFSFSAIFLFRPVLWLFSGTFLPSCNLHRDFCGRSVVSIMEWNVPSVVYFLKLF